MQPVKVYLIEVKWVADSVAEPVPSNPSLSLLLVSIKTWQHLVGGVKTCLSVLPRKLVLVFYPSNE